MRPSRSWLVVPLVAFMAGCGDTEPPEYPVRGTDEEQIRAVVEIANVAAENHDGHLLCREVLPPEGYNAAEIEECGDDVTAAMEESPENWEGDAPGPSRIDVDGDFAEVYLGSSNLAEDFVKQRGRWRWVFFE